jgi:recombination protein RecA
VSGSRASIAALAPFVYPPSTAPPHDPAWQVAALAGRLVELCAGRASAVLTAAFGLVLDAQQRDEPVAWISDRASSFYPPDAAANGIDLERLIVVRVPSAALVPRAAEFLARSAAFGLLVLDLGAANPVPVAAQSRLLSLAQKHSVAVVCLTEPERAPAMRSPLGSLVSLRLDARRTRRAPGLFECRLHAIKDKQHAPGWEHRELCCGPAGVC